MKDERNWLLRDALPELQSFALEVGAQLQLVDLNWGVSDDMALDPDFEPIRLEQIHLCRQHSCGPNFVVSDCYTIVCLVLVHVMLRALYDCFLRRQQFVC